MKRLTSILALTILLIVLSPIPTRAELIITFKQTLPDEVTATGVGTIDLTGLQGIFSGQLIGPVVVPFRGSLAIGSGTEGLTQYVGVTGPPNFGPGGLTFATSGTEDTIAIDSNDIFLPDTYTGGTTLNSSATWDGATFASLGLTSGTYTYTWGVGGPDHTLQVQIPTAAAVPEPSTAIGAVFGAAAFLAYGWSRHRREQRRQAA
jgi:hypothetical protein